MGGIRVIEPSDFKLVLLSGSDMFILAGKTLCVIASHNKSTAWSIIVKIGPKLSGELFKILLVTQGFDPIASRHITR